MNMKERITYLLEKYQQQKDSKFIHISVKQQFLDDFDSAAIA